MKTILLLLLLLSFPLYSMVPTPIDNDAYHGDLLIDKNFIEGTYLQYLPRELRDLLENHYIDDWETQKLCREATLMSLECEKSYIYNQALKKRIPNLFDKLMSPEWQIIACCTVWLYTVKAPDDEVTVESLKYALTSGIAGVISYNFGKYLSKCISKYI